MTGCDIGVFFRDAGRISGGNLTDLKAGRARISDYSGCLALKSDERTGMTIRILGYSLTGNTAAVWNRVASELGAETHRISAPGPAKPGLLSILRLGFSALTGRRTRIEVPEVAWADCDLLILGCPVWAGRVASPMRQWLMQRPDLPKKVALIVTSGNPARPEAVFDELHHLTGRRPIATLHLGEAQVKSGDYDAAVHQFCAEVTGVITDYSAQMVPQVARAG